MTFTYDETRDSEHLRVLTPAIDAFIQQCQRPRATASTSSRQTMFFLPGGIASSLSRATQKFADGVAAPQTFDYEAVWATCDTFLGGARDLKMYRDGAGAFRDKGDRIIVADGAVILGYTPHQGLIDWCASHNVDLFVFPWDWRRRLDEAVKMFVGKFLPFFRARVLAAGCPDPFARFSLVGHSFGGMIVNLILRGNDPIVANMTHAITVATPFYGYPGQVHRWFEGEPLLNGASPPGGFKQDMMETIASLPGLYSLHLLDEGTWSNTANQSVLTAHDPEFPLPSYPSMDATNAGLRADPYNPQTNGSLRRFPAMTGFDRHELEYARLQFQQLAAPMDAKLLEKFYNIRGVRTESDEQTLKSDTAASVSWDWIPASFDSADTSPIVDVTHVPGDDTQPAWSARLATNDSSRCITIRASDIHHMSMMSHALVLNAIQAILGVPGAAMSPRDMPQPEPASDEDLVEFMRWMSENPGPARAWPRFDDPAFRKLVPPRFRKNIDAIARRIVMDIMKRPAAKGLIGPQAPPRKSGGRKPVAGKRRRKSRKKKR